MTLIPCGQPCRHQREGYCTLEGTPPVQQVGSGCPYFHPQQDALPRSKEQLNRLRQAADANQLNLWPEI